MEKLAEPKRLSRIEEVLKGAVILMLKSAPENETNRALVLAAVKKPLPPEADTYEKIKDWIETNISPIKAINMEADAITATVVHTDAEHGRCNYTRQRRGSSTYNITNERMFEILQKARDVECTFTGLVELIHRELCDDAREQEWPDMEFGDEETYDHEETETSNHLCTVRDHASVAARLRQWINTYAPGEFTI